MGQKIVLRVLGAADELLGWTETFVVPRRGVLIVDSAVRIPIHTAGTATEVVAHWCDVDVAVRVPVACMGEVLPGDTIVLPDGITLIRVKGDDVPLPPVTVRSTVTLSPAPGAAGG